MIDEEQQLFRESQYADLEKNFITHANLTTVNTLDITADLEPFVTLPSLGTGIIGRYINKDDKENLLQNIIVRKSVYKKLQDVNASLKRKKKYKNCQLVVVYGYRGLDVQQEMFNDEQKKIKADNPSLSDIEITEMVHRRIAVPSVAGHPTGGAVDVIIYDFVNEQYLDFGTDIRDFSTKDRYYDSPFIKKSQKNNRLLLRQIMTTEDFAPYNGEWWHFSYGDKEWAFYKYQRANRNKKNIDDIRELKYLYSQKSLNQLVYTDEYLNSSITDRSDLVRLAVQKKGRLTDDTINILAKSGIDVAYDEGKFFGKCRNLPLEIIFVRDDDITNLVDAGVADIGIVGENIFNECNCKSEILRKLGFGRCSLNIAIPESSSIRNIFELSNKRVATSYRKSVEKFFNNEGIKDVEILELSGSVEMAPIIGYADAIADLVSTGSSLKQNKLRSLHKIFDSESILIANKTSLNNQHKRKTIDKLETRINGCLDAKRYKYIMFSVSSNQIKKVISILSSAKLLSSSNTFNDDEYNVVSAIVSKESIWEIIDQLCEVKAIDVVFYDIEVITSVQIK